MAIRRRSPFAPFAPRFSFQCNPDVDLVLDPALADLVPGHLNAVARRQRSGIDLYPPLAIWQARSQ